MNATTETNDRSTAAGRQRDREARANTNDYNPARRGWNTGHHINGFDLSECEGKALAYRVLHTMLDEPHSKMESYALSRALDALADYSPANLVDCATCGFARRYHPVKFDDVSCYDYDPIGEV